jgi:hypothetical protein
MELLDELLFCSLRYCLDGYTRFLLLGYDVSILDAIYKVTFTVGFILEAHISRPSSHNML